MATQVKAPKPIHSYAHLAFQVKRGDLVFFTAPSRHDERRINTVSLDLTSGETLCDCRFAETRAPDDERRCWHRRHVPVAWIVYQHRQELAPYRVTDARLRAIAAEAGATGDTFLIAACGDETLARLVRAEAKKAALADAWREQGEVKPAGFRDALIEQLVQQRTHAARSRFRDAQVAHEAAQLDLERARERVRAARLAGATHGAIVGALHGGHHAGK